MAGMYESATPEEFAERALIVKEGGYTAVKFMPAPRTEPVEGIRSIHYAESLVLAVREAVGAEMAQVTRASRIPIATGERLVSRHQFREIFEKWACHIIQPDLSHCGSLWEARKIAAMAEAYSIAVAPHNPNGPIATAVAVHFALATPNWLIQETISDDVLWRNDVLDHPMVVENGTIGIPERPRLGIEVNEKAAAKNPFKPEAEQRYFHADGAAADW